MSTVRCGTPSTMHSMVSKVLLWFMGRRGAARRGRYSATARISRGSLSRAPDNLTASTTWSSSGSYRELCLIYLRGWKCVGSRADKLSWGTSVRCGFSSRLLRVVCSRPDSCFLFHLLCGFSNGVLYSSGTASNSTGCRRPALCGVLTDPIPTFHGLGFDRFMFFEIGLVITTGSGPPNFRKFGLDSVRAPLARTRLSIPFLRSLPFPNPSPFHSLFEPDHGRQFSDHRRGRIAYDLN